MDVKPVPWYQSHRVWAMIAAIGAGLPTSGYAIAAGVAMIAVNPIAGIAAIVGAGISLAATGGLAYYGITSNRNVQFRKPTE